MKHPAIGVVITWKYRLERPLASGGMGSVWVARHIELGMPVAIKFMSPELVGSGEARMRFEREAKAAALLQSPYVVSVQDYGVDDHLPYIVMEFMQGEDLEERLSRRGRLPPSEVWTIASQIAKGLRRAHEMGIVHRDLKPRNLFLARHDEDETIKILDFGIAKARSPHIVTEATATGSVMGSPLYMSPEQVRGAKDIDLRTDLWSFGVVLFQMLTGQTPFRGEVVGDVIGKILADPIPRATSFVPDLPPALDAFFDRALARDRAIRFQSAREMVDALGDIAGRPSLAPVAPSPAVIVTIAQPPLVAPITERLESAPPAAVDAPQDGVTGLAAITTTIPLAASVPAPEPPASAPSGAEGTGAGAARGRPFPWLGVAAVAAALSVAITVVMLVIPQGGGPTSAAVGGAPAAVAGEIAPEQAGAQGQRPSLSAEPAPPPAIAPAPTSLAPAASLGAPAASSVGAPHLAAPALSAAPVSGRPVSKSTPKGSSSVDENLGF